jgi:hypothetical protein
VNPRLARLHRYPFEKLRQLFAGITPNLNLREIKLSIGERQHATPAFIKEALSAGLGVLARYPTMLGTPGLRLTMADLTRAAPRPRLAKRSPPCSPNYMRAGCASRGDGMFVSRARDLHIELAEAT